MGAGQRLRGCAIGVRARGQAEAHGQAVRVGFARAAQRGRAAHRLQRQKPPAPPRVHLRGKLPVAFPPFSTSLRFIQAPWDAGLLTTEAQSKRKPEGRSVEAL